MIPKNFSDILPGKKFLTAQEKEIACRIAAGETVKQIASVMQRHPHVIDWHISKLKKRFDSKSLPQLVVELTVLGLLSD